MAKVKANARMVTKTERYSYGLYFLGQNIFYGLIYMYLSTYFTDIGITAIAVSGIMLVVKVWDAINDPLFGGLIDRIKFKKGKFVPWLRISLVGIPIVTIFMFAIPTGLSMTLKIAWAVVAYLFWSTAYTICDVPIFGLVTTMTDVQQERTSLNAVGRIFGMASQLLVMIIIPTFRNVIGGWTATIIVLSVIGATTMLPICFCAKERVAPRQGGEQGEVGIRQMFSYLKKNKYLFIFYVAFLVKGVFDVTATWNLYIGRYCLKNESIISLVSLVTYFPMILVGMSIPYLCKKIDKFKVYYAAAILTAVGILLKLIVGYENITAYLVISLIGAIPAGASQTLLHMFTPDCVEYGYYKTGISAPGITFSVQTFFTKMQAALVATFATFILAMMGFMEGEGAQQSAGFTQNLWVLSCIIPVVGIVISLVVLKFYKLNDHDVQLMAKCNNGELSREEAEKEMSRQF